MFQFIRTAVKSQLTKVLIFALRKNWGYLAKICSFFGADVNHVNNAGMTPLLEALLTRENIELMRLLIKNGANVNIACLHDGLSPLTWATQRRNTEAIQLLIDNGANVNHSPTHGCHKGQTPLYFSSIKNI